MAASGVTDGPYFAGIDPEKVRDESRIEQTVFLPGHAARDLRGRDDSWSQSGWASGQRPA